MYCSNLFKMGDERMMDSKFELSKLQESLKRDAFEKYDDYEKRIKSIKAVNIGKAALQEESYDSEYGFCYVKIAWYGIDSVEKIKSQYFFCMISSGTLNGNIDFNDKYDVYCKFVSIGEKVYIDNESLNIGINGENYKIYCVDLYRQAFESYDEFKSRIANIKPMPFGKIKFSKDNYDIKTSSIILSNDWNIIKEINVPKVYGLFSIIDNLHVKEICEKDREYVLYGKLMLIDKVISIDMGNLFIMADDRIMTIYSICVNKFYFHDEDKFNENIKNISLISAGKIRLNPSKYDFEKEIFVADVIWKKWAVQFTSQLCSFSIDTPRNDAKELYRGGGIYDTYISFLVDEDKVSIDKINAITFNKTISLDYEAQDSEIVVSSVTESDNPNDMNFDNNMELNLMRYISDKGKYGYMDSSKRKIVIEPKYDYIGSFYDGVARVNINGKWGFINLNGETVIQPKFNMVKDFHDGLAAFNVRKVGTKKWGYVDLSGKIVIEARFSEAGDFYNGVASVKLQGFLAAKKNVYINNVGKVINYKKVITAK